MVQSRSKLSAAAAKDCIDLNKHELYPSYGDLFLEKTKNCEVIFSIVYSSDLEINSDGVLTTQKIGSFIARSAGGTHNAQPSGTSCSI